MDDEIDRERLQWPDLDALEVALRDGDYMPLADYLRTDYPLHADTREWLAELVLGNVRRKPGNPRNKDSRLENWRLFRDITRMIADGDYASEAEAVAKYSKDLTKKLNEKHDDPDRDMFDSVKSRYNRAKKLWGVGAIFKR